MKICNVYRLYLIMVMNAYLQSNFYAFSFS